MVKDFAIETVEVDGFPIQTFRHRFKNVWEMFSHASRVYAGKEFLVEGANRLTFRETVEKVAQVAAYLGEKMGGQRKVPVGILMENSITFVITFLAIQQCGATAVVFNNRLAPPELKRQIQISDIKLLLSSPQLSAKAQESLPDSPAVNHIILEPLEKTEAPGELLPARAAGEDDPALILFTSGTVGNPKGVIITHRNLITSAFKQGYYFSQHYDLQTQESIKTVIAAPLFHVLALQEQLMAAIFLGFTCILVSSFKPQEILDLFTRERINILAGTPTMYWMLLHKTAIRSAGLDCIKMIVYGGAPMPPDLLLELRQTFPGMKCINGYGLTEASVISILDDDFCELRPTSVGQPSLCSEVKVVDPSGQEMGPHGIGELIVQGALVSKGYYKLPEETAEVYREGWFYTGDMAYRDPEGFIFLVGRTREMINRGGENVYPVEVENILHLHPKVLDVAVFGLADPVLGETVECAVVLRPGIGELSLQEIQEFCQSKLADYKIPQKIFLVPDLPRNPGGKVLKKILVEQTLNLLMKKGEEGR
jgi:acyl-CoA synthetase (AMP-forming)/AMP-acid ligase II